MGAGNNLGIKNVNNDFALILNPDVVLRSNTIDEIIFASKKVDTFSIIAPIMEEENYPNYKFEKKKEFTRFAKGKITVSNKGNLEFEVFKGQESFKLKPLSKSNAWGQFNSGQVRFKKGDLIDCHTTFGVNFL